MTSKHLSLMFRAISRRKNLKMDERRSYYSTRAEQHMVPLKEIITWPQYYKIKLFNGQSPQRMHEINSNFNNRISLWSGDITQLAIDAIVNAANSSLMGGGGVDGCIHRAAGQALKRECAGLNGCEAGDAKVTSGHRLPSKYVIHTVGPMGQNRRKLESCYKRCLQHVEEREMKSIAFCCVSTGVYGYPNEAAAHTALETVRTWFETSNYAQKIERIIFCVFLQVDRTIYERLLQSYFPIDTGIPPARPANQHELNSSARNSEHEI